MVIITRFPSFIKRQRKTRVAAGISSSRLLLVFLDVKDFLAAVIATLGANAVRTDHRAAMGASDQAGHFELEVAAAESFTGLGDTSLRYCHGFTPPIGTGEIKLVLHGAVNEKT